MAEPRSVLVVDDDPHFRALVELLLGAHGHVVAGAASIAEAVAEGPAPGCLLLDWQLGPDDGLAGLDALRRRFPCSPVILTTAHSSTDVAARAIRLGAFEFLPKPLDEPRLVAVVASAFAQADLLRELEGLRAGTAEGFEGIVARSPSMLRMFETIDGVARTDASVLITGESGTGKELVARALHRRSRRAGPFVALNMSAIPRDLVESTLFGHDKGAFSGADRRRVGACEEAHRGTLFLDEIGEMPIDLQPKLLRFLQDHALRRVGGSEDVHVDVRVVAATNRDPEDAVRRGLLRADLLYRLNVVRLALPALRDRREDIGPIATAAVRAAARRYGKGLSTLDPEALARLEAHPWPGNIRELVHLMERVAITGRGEVVLPDMLDLPRTPGTPAAAAAPDELPEGATLAQAERAHILRAFERHGGNRRKAAAELGIHRTTLAKKLEEYGVAPAGPAGDEA